MTQKRTSIGSIAMNYFYLIVFNPVLIASDFVAYTANRNKKKRILYESEIALAEFDLSRSHFSVKYGKNITEDFRLYFLKLRIQLTASMQYCKACNTMA
jgi:hypothetical protein